MDPIEANSIYGAKLLRRIKEFKIEREGKSHSIDLIQVLKDK